MPKKHLNNDNKYDFKLDLAWGQKREDELFKILSHGDKIELKSEKSKWNTTGNIAVETTSRGKDSGINVTKSKWWAVGLTYKNKTLGFFIFRTDIFKKNLAYLIKNKKIKKKTLRLRFNK